MLMLDLFSGLGGASQAMKARGWDVITVDNDPRFGCTYTADLLTWEYEGPTPDLIWASPPCTYFSRHDMPWFPNEPDPDLTLVNAARRIIKAADPRFYVIENVRGAIPYLGKPTSKHGPFCLWGYYPTIRYHIPMSANLKGGGTGGKVRDPALRAKIPSGLSLALAEAVESQLQLPVFL